MPTLKQTYQSVHGSISDSAFCRIKKIIVENGFELNRQTVKTFATAKTVFKTNIETILYMRYVYDIEKKVKKNEVVNYFQSKQIPYQTYHKWLKDIRKKYLDYEDLCFLIVKIIKWSKKNERQEYECIVNQIPPKKVRD